MSTWPSKNVMDIGTGFPHTNEFVDFLKTEKIEGVEFLHLPWKAVKFTDPIILAMIEMLEEGFHSGTAQEFVEEQLVNVGFFKSRDFEEDGGEETDAEQMKKSAGNLAAEIMVQNFKDLLLIRREAQR